MRLLIVEDDLKTARALAAGLERAGFSAATAHTGEEGFFLLGGLKFARVFSSSHTSDNPNTIPPAKAADTTHRTTAATNENGAGNPLSPQ
jgi:CheY-like chemotaxis protein